MDTAPDRRANDRRQHVRFAMGQADSELEVLTATDETPRVNACELRNLSFSGMSFAATAELDLQHDYSFRIRVGLLQREPFSAKAEIRWKQPSPEGPFIYGARFRESSKGWFESVV